MCFTTPTDLRDRRCVLQCVTPIQYATCLSQNPLSSLSLSTALLVVQ